MKTLVKFAGVIAASGVLFNYAIAGDLGVQALSFVPGGKVLQEKYDEVKIQTAKGSIIEVEFTRSGKFDEASGNNAAEDAFKAPNGLVSLETAVKGLKDAKKQPTAEWSLDSSIVKGWIYEFEGYENGQEMEYYVDAKTGKFLKASVDN